MGTASSPPASTIRRGCGTRPTANWWPSSRATRARSMMRRSRPMVSASSPPAATVQRECGTWPTAELLAKLEGDTGSVNDAFFSPDGQRIVTASGDKTARVWNAADGQLLLKIEGHTAAVPRVFLAQRPAHRHRQQGQHGAGVELANGQLAGQARRPHGPVSMTRRSRPTASTSSPPAWTARRGCGTRRMANWWPSSKATPTGLTCGLLARRPAHRHCQRGQHGAGVERGQRPTAWPSSKATRAVSSTRRSRPTASASSPPARTRRRGCGTRSTVNWWPSSKATRAVSGTRRSRPTASASSPPARTTRRGCGTRPTANCVATLEGHTGFVWHAAFSPDGQRIVTASKDKTARVYRVVMLSNIAELFTM